MNGKRKQKTKRRKDNTYKETMTEIERHRWSVKPAVSIGLHVEDSSCVS